ncbi:GerMN domain-containing protein [Phascolarctobacterium sp.]|uniref:GerMN domain-containing protein n=1 Tax=Phascolarctobacterium sp. TaxID=2049039 RepID=UPI00386E2F6E
MQKLVILLVLLCTLLSAGCFGNGDKVVEPAKPPQQEIKQQSFIVYRAAANGMEKLLPEKFTINDNGKSVPENALIALCTTKPQDAKMDDVVPIGAKVRSLKIDKDGTAYADFSKELAKRGQGSYGEMMLCYAIVNTLTEFPEIKRVQILVEGEKVISLSGHMNVEDPLMRNTDLL